MSVLAVTTRPSSRRRTEPGAGTGGWRASAGAVPPSLLVAAVVAWLVLVGAEVFGASRVLHHDEVLGGERLALASLGSFLLTWTVMATAMMLPTALLAVHGGPSDGTERDRRAAAAFLAGFMLVWAAFGGVALTVDVVVHAVVDRMPALASRPSLVAAALLGAAGAVQLMPFVRRGLAVRHPMDPSSPATAFRSGRAQARACVTGDGALMLVMFAAAGRLVWMVLLTILMCAERVVAGARSMAYGVGVTLLTWAVLIVLGPPWVPSPFGAL